MMDQIFERILYNHEILEKEGARSLDVFREKKRNYHRGLLDANILLLKKKIGELKIEKQKRAGLMKLAEEIEQDIPGTIEKMLALLPEPLDKEGSGFRPVPKTIPSEIRSDIRADMDEISRCMQAGCYRSVAILCGRLLEVALHRKYYEATGVDLLEKSPGIGLGKIIAKLSEKQVDLDPGISQQVHLINQVRIFSVHHKQTAFEPNRNQAQAMVLYTNDVLERMFL